MKVRMKTSMAGTHHAWRRDQEVEVSDAEGLRLCDAGFAEPLGPETASVVPAETAAKPKGKPRGAKASNAAGN